MIAKRVLGIMGIVILLIDLGWLAPAGRVEAHCDTMDGPVVKTAQAALEKGDVTPVLKWVRPQQEAEVREAYKKTLAVRGLGKEAKDLADKYFFETLVRLHREGEGATYTGLRSAGTVEPIVAASDKALDTGSVNELTKEITKLVAEGIRHRFAETMEKKRHADESVAAGRESVEAYVEFTPYVERLHVDATGPAGHSAHAEKPTEPSEHQHGGHTWQACGSTGWHGQTRLPMWTSVALVAEDDTLKRVWAWHPALAQSVAGQGFS